MAAPRPPSHWTRTRTRTFVAGAALATFVAIVLALALALTPGLTANHGRQVSTPRSESPPPAAGSALQTPGGIDGVPLHPGRKRDEIHPIDQPVFAATAPNTAALSDDDWVIGVHHQGIARAYPLWILARCEIVNDRFDSEPVCVTYCPLSASALVFSARLNLRPTTFGNEGALYESNLVLYDRESNSLWYQLRGVAIAGPARGQSLTQIPAAVTRWGPWRRRFPTGTVLVGDGRSGRFFRVWQGASRDGTPAQDFPQAPVSRTNVLLGMMERVVGFRRGDRAYCLPESSLAGKGEGRIALGTPAEVLIETSPESGPRFVDLHGREVPLIPALWFAWHAAFPTGTVISNLGAATPAPAVDRTDQPPP